ncbi:hypothetical protein LZS85_15540 [Aliivibrio fischeri]|uniref:hypothetical protein n=1 Tax=Aliivibrio fischeri TaxID=668 RepID=UPI001F1B5B79|nr:hypothetical protein [Aliivibrio fischeri]MCE7567536.1 hypothetical protein [Aliivibrio fischeri]
MATRWYRQGTVTVTDNSRDVVGVGTDWTNAGNKPLAGDEFYIQGIGYEIEAIVDDTHIKLYEPFDGTSAAGVSYAIIRNTSINISSRIAAMVANAINSKQQYLSELNEFLTSSAPTVTMHDSIGNPLSMIPIPTLVKNVSKISQGTTNLTKTFTKIQDLTNKAELWANAAKDTEVEKGKFSARHFSEKTEDIYVDAKKVKSEIGLINSSANTTKADIEQLKQDTIGIYGDVDTARSDTLDALADTQALVTKATKIKDITNQIANHSLDSAELSRKWAEEAHNTPVLTTTDATGKKINHFSSYHWQKETAAVYDLTHDILADTKTVKSGIDTIKTVIDGINTDVVAKSKAISAAHTDIQSLFTATTAAKKDTAVIKDSVTAIQTKVTAELAKAEKAATDAKASEKAAQGFSRPFSDGGDFQPTTAKEYPTGLTGNAVVVSIKNLPVGSTHTFATGQLKGQQVRNGDILLAINIGSTFKFFIISAGGGGSVSTAVTNINGKTGNNITLVAADIGTLTTAEISAKYRALDDHDFSQSTSDLDLGENDIVSGSVRIARYKKDRDRIEIGQYQGKEVLIRTGAKQFQVEIDGNIRTLMTSFDATKLIDSRALLLDGSAEMTGPIVFSPSAHQQTDYDFVNLSNAIAGSKNLIRKIRGAKTNMIWHETIQDNLYRLATGNSDSKEVFRLDSNLGKAYVASAEVYTTANKPNGKDIGAIVEQGGGTLRSGYFDIKPDTAIRADMTTDAGKYRDTAEILKMTKGDSGVLEIGSNKAPLKFFYKGTILVEDTNGGSHELYHQGNKPTAADLNLRSNQQQDSTFTKKSGDTVTGKLVIDRGADNTPANALELKGMSPAPLKIQRTGDQVGLMFSANLKNAYLGLAADGSLRWGANLDHSQNGKVYTSQSKPTAKELNLEPALKANQRRAIFTGTKAPTTAEIAAMSEGDLFLVHEA